MTEWVDFLARATDRHHLTREQILSALATAVYDEPLPEDPARHLVLGNTDDGQPLEVVPVPQPDDGWLVIHAMPLNYRPPHPPPPGHVRPGERRPTVTTHSPTAQTRDADGNITGVVHLADGTTETVDQLDAWADAFEHDDHPAPLTPPRPGRPNLARRHGHPHDTNGESPRITVRLPRPLLDRIDAAAATTGTTRAELLRDAIEGYLDLAASTR